MKILFKAASIILLLLVSTALYAASKPSAFEMEKENADNYYDNQDYKKAKSAYTKLARKGDKYSQFRLSLIFLDGLSGKADISQAYGWATLAAQVRHPGLLAYRDLVFNEIPENGKRKAIAKADKLMLRYSDFVIAEKAVMRTKRDLRNCTGSRLGRSCEQLTFTKSLSGPGAGPGGGPFLTPEDSPAAGFTSTSGQSAIGTGVNSNVKYYTDLRETIRSLEDFIIAYKEGNVQIGDFEVLEDEDGNAIETPEEQ